MNNTKSTQNDCWKCKKFIENNMMLKENICKESTKEVKREGIKTTSETKITAPVDFLKSKLNGGQK